MAIHQTKDFTRLSRRSLIAGTAAAAATSGLYGTSLAQVSTPATLATPIPAADVETFATFTKLVVGVDDLPQNMLDQSYQLITGTTDGENALQQLLDAGNSVNLDKLPDPQQAVVNNMLEYWYLGNFNGNPVENREEIFANLLSYGALPYITVRAVCKGFGYWAKDFNLPDRS